MPKLETAIAGAFSLLLLTACGSKEAAPVDNSALNSALSAESEGSGTDVADEPAEAGGLNASADPVRPPDAVSHPEGYLPPNPAEPGPATSNSSGPGAPPPATEDQYIRNGQ